MDFIYVGQDEDDPYEIGQILDFTQDFANNIIQLQIRKLKHYSDFAAKHGLYSSNQANWKNDEVCDNISLIASLLIESYFAILASSLLHITNTNYSC